MARFPITNEQFKIYQEFNYRSPLDNWKQKKDHPFIGNNYFFDYFRWLNNLLQSELPSGLLLRIPTEAEWEKAARGTDGREYPWGNQFDINKCNTSEGGKRSTTPVGLYSPQGDSPYGCADMAGNVWELTQSLRQAYPYKEKTIDEKAPAQTVVRGGSFLNTKTEARCACRSVSGLSYFANRGIRICLAPPLSK